MNDARAGPIGGVVSVISTLLPVVCQIAVPPFLCVSASDTRETLSNPFPSSPRRSPPSPLQRRLAPVLFHLYSAAGAPLPVLSFTLLPSIPSAARSPHIHTHLLSALAFLYCNAIHDPAACYNIAESCCRSLHPRWSPFQFAIGPAVLSECLPLLPPVALPTIDHP